MIACEVTKHEDTGRPCVEDGTSIAVLVYPNGLRETKRCCAHHRLVIEAASAEALRAIEKRDADRRAEADARRARLTERAERGQARSAGLPVVIPPPKPRKPMPTVDESQLAPLPLPGSSMKGLWPACRWPGCKSSGPGRPLCAAVHRNRLLSMSKDGDVPRDFDPETCDPANFVKYWADRQTRIENERKAKRGPAPMSTPADLAAERMLPEPVPIQTYPLAPFLADLSENEGGPKYPDAGGLTEGAGVTIPGESATPAGWAPVGPVHAPYGHPPPGQTEVEALRAWAERAEAALAVSRDALDEARQEVAAAHLTLDAAQIQSGFPLDRRIAKLTDRARDHREAEEGLADVLAQTAKERDEAVDAISSARADSAELAALREFMHGTGKGDGLAGPTHRALAAYDDRRGVGSEPAARRPAYDVPRLLAVTEYAVGQLLDLIEDEADRDLAATPHVLRALRALTLGRVPEAKG